MSDKSNLIIVTVAAVIVIHIGIITRFIGYQVSGNILFYGGVAVAVLSMVRIVRLIDADREEEKSRRSRETGEEETRSE